jgi:hypothetical protein
LEQLKQLTGVRVAHPGDTGAVLHAIPSRNAQAKESVEPDAPLEVCDPNVGADEMRRNPRHEPSIQWWIQKAELPRGEPMA